jgi:prepilin signal peptidase PulO-like enzyme (type II secretory pathway)
MAVGGGFFLLQYLVSRGKWIGGGDVRFGVMMGVLLGWPNILVALFIAYVLGAVVAVPLLIFKKKKMKSEVPFGAFLAIGTAAAMFWGSWIVNWYVGMIK